MSIRSAIVTALLTISLSFMIFGQIQDGRFDEDLERRIIKREYTDISEKGRWELKAEYPALWNAGGKPAEDFNHVVKSTAMKQVDDFKRSMSEITDDDRNRLPKGVSYDLHIGYSVAFISDEIVSVNFGRSEYSGGAHPNHWSFTLNYDLKNSRLLKLEQLFTPNSGFLKVISDNSIKQIAEQQGKDADTDWIRRGAGRDLKNFSSWSITEEGLKFNFDPYQVGPYVAGQFETIVPYEKFSQVMRSNSFYPVSLASYIGGNPPNWCRNGHFPQYDVDFRLAKINGPSGESNVRSYFHKDEGGCPDGKNCRESIYVVPRDEVIVARSYGDFTCVWYQPRSGSETVGWLKTSELKINKAPIKPGRVNWSGDWESGENNIEFVETKTLGNYRITGNAFWRGLGDNIHIGELDFSGTAVKNKMEAGTGDVKYDCRVKMQRLGRYLIVSDNRHCGGMNVSFDGIYLKK